MCTTTRGFVAMFGSFALVTFISLPPVMAAQAPAPAPGSASQAQAPKTETAKGELRSVDAIKKTLTVAVEGGSPQTFMYTDTTKVSGAQGGVEGLGSMSGRTVTVQYTMKGGDRIASSIEVAAK
jgi:ABC-type amino acid transport substrate-binding protein